MNDNTLVYFLLALFSLSFLLFNKCTVYMYVVLYPNSLVFPPCIPYLHVYWRFYVQLLFLFQYLCAGLVYGYFKYIWVTVSAVDDKGFILQFLSIIIQLLIGVNTRLSFSISNNNITLIRSTIYKNNKYDSHHCLMFTIGRLRLKYKT